VAVLNRPTGPHLVIGARERAAVVCAQLQNAGTDAEAVDHVLVEKLAPVDACALGGWLVRCGGSERVVRGVVALGSPLHLPWLDPGLLDWDLGRPALVAGLLAPGFANLYLVGPAAESFSDGGIRLVVAMVAAQSGLDHPLVDELVLVAPSSHRTVRGRAARRIERRLDRHLRTGDGGWWRAAAGDVDGPLSAARGA
jgi:hypothetical protein